MRLQHKKERSELRTKKGRFQPIHYRKSSLMCLNLMSMWSQMLLTDVLESRSRLNITSLISLCYNSYDQLKLGFIIIPALFTDLMQKVGD